MAGIISIGLVNTPVRAIPLTIEKKVIFRMLHQKCRTPISYRLFCEEGDEVSKSEIAFGYSSKLPHCPNCNFPMPRSRLIFAILPSLGPIKMAKRNILQSFHSQAKRIIFTRRATLGLKLDASRHYFQWMMIINTPYLRETAPKTDRAKAKR